MKKSLIVLLMVLLIICGCEKKEAPHTDNGEKQVMPLVPEKYIGAFYRDAGKNHYTLFLRGDNTFRLLVGNDIYVSRVVLMIKMVMFLNYMLLLYIMKLIIVIIQMILKHIKTL